MLNFNFLFFLGLVFLITACSSDQKVIPQTPAKPQTDLTSLKQQCDLQGMGLSCAQYGYLVKKEDPATGLRYTEKACELKHEQSCFNVVQFKSRAIEHNANIIRVQNDQVLSCYVLHSEDKDDSGFSLKKKDDQKVITMVFTIEPSGKLSQLTVKGQKLSGELRRCVDNVYASKKFIGSEVIQNINYDLVLPFVEGKPDNTKEYF